MAWISFSKKKKRSGDAPSVEVLYAAIMGCALIAALIFCVTIKNTAGGSIRGMDLLNSHIQEYRTLSSKDKIQRAHKTLIQADYIELLGSKKIGGYELSNVSPGVDSIIGTVLVDQPDFEQPRELKMQIEKKAIGFINDFYAVLDT